MSPVHLLVSLLLSLTVLGLALPVSAQQADNPYSIMRPEPGEPAAKPEPWLAPKYRSPRAGRRPAPTPKPARQPHHAVPPALYVPETGRVLPNLPAPTGSGPGGSETYQDRAARCAHQAGVYGQAAGDRTTYINSCINQ